MIVLMILLAKTKDYVIYKYGYDENSLDGIIKIYFDESIEPEIKMSNDIRIGNLGTLKALGKLKKLISKNQLKEKIVYQS